MRKLAMALVLGSALLAGPALQAREKLTGEQQLDKLLEGRVAGRPVSCIPLSSSSDTQIIDKTAIVYDSGRTIYVNRPTNADTLDSDDIMVTRVSTSQLCRLDTVRMHNRLGHNFSGFVSLQDFVPYTRVVRTN
jgi:hypothetical protein